MKFFIAAFTIIPLIFIVVGIFQAWHQHNAITTYLPVEAVVRSTDIERHVSSSSKGGSKVSYQPVVVYAYRVGGRDHQCRDVTPFTERGSIEWARGIVGRFAAGQKVEAYYNPSNPSKAFLLKHYSFTPYLFLLFPMLFLAVAAAIAFGAGASQRRPPDPVPSGGDLFEILPTSRVVDKARAAMIAAGAWYTVGILACGHFFSVADRPYDTEVFIFPPIYAGLGLIPLGLFIYYLLLGRNVFDARAAVDAGRFALGQRITVHAAQEFRRAVRVEEVAIKLVGEVTEKTGRKNSISTRKFFEETMPVLEDHPTQPGETLNVTAALDIPAGEHPSTPPGQKGYPQYRWSIRVSAKIDDSPDYEGRFPITVRSAASV